MEPCQVKFEPQPTEFEEFNVPKQENPAEAADSLATESGSAAYRALLKRIDGKTREEGVKILEHAASASQDCILTAQDIVWKFAPHIPSCRDRGEAMGAILDRKQECSVTIGFLGNTGDGKSSAINALVGLEQLLPNSTTFACTAVPVEISYNASDDPKEKFICEVYGVPVQDFTDELNNYYHDKAALDTNGGYGESGEHDPDIQERLNCTLSKISCIFPSIKTHSDMMKSSTDLILDNANVKKTLGKEFHIQAECLDEFREKIRRYIDTSESKDSNGKKFSIWPLIKVVELRVKSDILKCGITLVDLPGGRDTSAARSAVAANYLKKLNIACVLTRSVRAANDKGARDSLSQEAQRTMQMDGIYSSASLFFIISQTDLCLSSDAETKAYINDPDHKDLEQILMADVQKMLTNIKSISNSKKRQDELVAMRSKYGKMLPKAQKELQALQTQILKKANGPDAKSKKRKYQSLDDIDLSSIDEEPKSLIANHKEKNGEIERGKGVMVEKNEEWINLEGSIKEIEQEQTMIRARLKMACITHRNNLLTAAIQENFEKVRVQMGDKTDKTLKVFPICARAYQSLSKGDKDDALQSGFFNMSDTGIPALREGLINTTLSTREDNAWFTNEATDTTMTLLRMWAKDGGLDYKMSAEEREQVENALKQNIMELETELQKINKSTVDSITRSIETDLFETFSQIEKIASKKVSPTVQEWAQKPIVWSSHRAANKGLGEWITGKGYEIDWNEDLVNLYLGEIGLQWHNTFHRQLPLLRDQHVIATRQAFSDFCAALKTSTRCICPAMVQAVGLLEENLLRSHRGLKQHIEEIFAEIDTAKKDSHRLVKPIVQDAWEKVYIKCGKEGGSGHYDRNKKLHLKHAKSQGGSAMYKNASKAIKAALKNALGKLTCQFEESYRESIDEMKGEIDLMLERHSAAGNQTKSYKIQKAKKAALHSELEPHFQALEKIWATPVHKFELENDMVENMETNNSPEDEDEDDADEPQDLAALLKVYS